MNNRFNSSGLSTISSLRDELLFPVSQQFDKFFNDFFTAPNLDAVRAMGNYPKLDIYNDNDSFYIKVAVPGVKLEDLSVELVNQNDNTTDGKKTIIQISGQMNAEYRIDNDNTKMHFKELHKSKFNRSVVLPDFIEGEPEAELKDGILILKWKHNLDKPPEKKKISIKSVT
jgi:HSP20 family protein